MIEIDNLTKRFGMQHALRSINLKIDEGEMVTLFGPNGAGKTTLLKILATLSRPSSGRVLLRGHELTASWSEVRRYIGLVTHQSLLYPDLTAEENLAFYARLYDVPNAADRAREVLDWVGLLPRYHDRVRTYSRGMLQRLSIARALLHDPQIMLLDEPYSGLDEAAAQKLHTLLHRIHTEEPRRLTLMSTHDLERGLALANRVLILRRGKIVLDEPRGALDVGQWRATYLQYVG
ncbi:MAG: ABC transporter ATP-binding protein [Chloroflexota bacterium]|nr:ABC transporter ATP-binding protein [Chloroflexota bacterium]